MKRTIAALATLIICTAVACGGSKSAKSSGTTTTTDPIAYRTAYTVCLQFYNTDKARNAEPPTLTDDQADEIFVGLALQLKPAMQKDPRAWTKLNRAATKVRSELMADNTSDDDIEKAISDMGDACQAAKKAPPTPKIDFTPTPPSSSTTVAPTTTSA